MTGEYAGTAPTGRGRLTELDALRGIGALLVLNFHYTTRFHELFPAAPHVPFNIMGGNYRVLLFFAISGFAIFFSMAKLRSGWDFIANRAIRLLPAYWAAMLVTLAVEHVGHVTALYVPGWVTLVNLTMLQGYFYLPSVDGAYWTLKFEIGFYACMLTLWLVCRLRRIEWLLLGWLAVRVIYHLFLPDLPDRLTQLTVLAYIPFFAIGMLSYRVWRGERSWRQQAPFLAVVIGTVWLNETWDVLLFTILLIAVFWAVVEGRLGVICRGPLLWTGQISYSLYLVHQHVGWTIMLNADAAGLNPIFGYALAVIAAFALGALINRYVERPATAWLTERWTRLRAGGLHPAPVVGR